MAAHHHKETPFGLKPGDILVGGDGRDWSWAYIAFRDVAGSDGYMIDNLGNAWTSKGRGYKPGRSRRWTMMEPGPNEWGYPRVRIKYGDEYRSVFVHVLVLEAFVGPCPEGMECRHLDGDPANPRLDNLAWGTPAQNTEDKARHGTLLRGGSVPMASISDEQAHEVCRLLQEGHPPWRVSALTGAGGQTVHGIRSRRYWTHVSDGYTFPERTESNRAAGALNWASKLSPNAVREIRRLSRDGATAPELAPRFGLTPSSIRKVVRRETYANVLDSDDAEPVRITEV